MFLILPSTYHVTLLIHYFTLFAFSFKDILSIIYQKGVGCRMAQRHSGCHCCPKEEGAGFYTQSGAFLSRVCMFSPCLVGFLLVLQFPLTVQKHVHYVNCRIYWLISISESRRCRTFWCRCGCIIVPRRLDSCHAIRRNDGAVFSRESIHQTTTTFID